MWIIVYTGLAILSASFYQIVQKTLTNTYRGVEISQISLLVSALVYTGFILYQGLSFEQYTQSTFILTLLSGILIGGGNFALAKGLELSDISVVSPVQQTIPIFAGILEPIILTQFEYESTKLIAAVIVVIGAFIITGSANTTQNGFIPNSIDKRGILFGLLSALLYGTSSIISHSVTQTVGIWHYLIVQVTIGFFVITIARKLQLPAFDKQLLEYGLLYSISLALQVHVISILSASLATILFRVSLVINVLAGYIVFKEQNIKLRLIGSLFILIGIYISIM